MLVVPDDVQLSMLAPEIRAELGTLSRSLATAVAKHLVMAGRLVDEEPELALAHAREARRMASRIGVVREAAGITAYHAGEWAEALTELRAARRLTGDVGHLPLIADSERALGRPERALRLAHSEDAAQLDPASRAELRLVEAGARRDLGELEAALLVLRGGGLDRSKVLPWSARLWYAYADTLLAAERDTEAVDWFLAVASIDTAGETDVDERLVELGVLEPIVDEDESDQVDSPTETLDATAEEPASVDHPDLAAPTDEDDEDPADEEDEESEHLTLPSPVDTAALFQEPATDPTIVPASADDPVD